MTPKKTTEMWISPEDQQDILEYIEYLDNEYMREKISDNMSIVAILFCADILKTFRKFITHIEK